MKFTETVLSEDKDIPERIEHGCDVIVNEGNGSIEQYYNYLDYYFSGVGFGLRARAYIDEMDVVTLHGFAREDSRESVSPAQFATPRGQEILRFLSRRYLDVRILHGEGYVDLRISDD